MILRKIAPVVFLLNTFSAFAGDIKYPVSTISEELKRDVDVVVREEQWVFKILSRSSANWYVHEVHTIFNERGKWAAEKTIFYDKLTKIADINAFIYDAEGKQIKRIKNKDISDQAAVDYGTLFSDDRAKIIDMSQSIYPYTVEIEYELDFGFLYFIPSESWGGERISHERASYQLVYPKSLKPRHQLLNSHVEPLLGILPNDFESLTWTFTNLKPDKIESNGLGYEEVIPRLLVAPSSFEFSGYSGNMETWLDYGKWQQSLNKGRTLLPEQTKLKIKEITRDLSTREEKAKAVYEYVQNRTRYVGIQLGIGGWQPFPASVVDEMGYGDCKALSNYTVALLKEAGVNGYYTIIRAGENARSINADFPSNQFNHIVVAVPNDKDTLWLECTSQTNPFGYQGTFTEDRWALMVTEAGGQLVKTINYKPEQNLQSRTAELTIDAAGNAKAKIRTTAKGIQYENGHLNYFISSPDKQRKWIEKNTEIPNFNINRFSITEIKNKIPSAVINLDLTLPRYASVSGKRLFISPNLMNKVSSIPPKIGERKTDVVLKNNYLDLDTIKFSFPENLYPEFLPEAIKINSKFGEYEASFQFDAGKVTYIRRMKMWKGRFPKETYNELVDFYKSVSKADNIKLVFLNKT